MIDRLNGLMYKIIQNFKRRKPMAIEVGDIFILKRRIDRVFGYQPDKLAYADYWPIPKGAKVTILDISGGRAKVSFKAETIIVAGICWSSDAGVQEIELDALYNAADVYDKSHDEKILLLERINASRQALRACRKTVGRFIGSAGKKDKIKLIRSLAAGLAGLTRGIADEFRK